MILEVSSLTGPRLFADTRPQSWFQRKISHLSLPSPRKHRIAEPSNPTTSSPAPNPKRHHCRTSGLPNDIIAQPQNSQQHHHHKNSSFLPVQHKFSPSSSPKRKRTPVHRPPSQPINSPLLSPPHLSSSSSSSSSSSPYN